MNSFRCPNCTRRSDEIQPPADALESSSTADHGIRSLQAAAFLEKAWNSPSCLSRRRAIDAWSMLIDAALPRLLNLRFFPCLAAFRRYP